ncbi:MAG TPA: hypothetical protein VGG63_17340 [Steroidobacteraceae bacterium]
MNRIAQPEAFRLLETGVAVPFRVVKEEVLPAPDESEFGMRVSLQLEDPEDPEGDAQEIVEWGAFGFVFVRALLSFADARPRGFSESEYNETDDLRLADFIAGLTFRRGALYFHADYLRGRRVKTGITVTAHGLVTIETIGRGKGPLRWIDRLKGKDGLRVVGT